MSKKRLKISIGDKFHRWTVIDNASNRIQPNGSVKKRYLCKCECGNIKEVDAQHLKDGSSKSCGCLAKEMASSMHKNYNFYELYDEVTMRGYTSNTNKAFYFDKEDYSLIKDFSWYEYNGYITTKNNLLKEYPSTLKLHRLVMKENNSKNVIDHINHNTFDNRKENLRIATHSQNSMNHKINENNTSGKSGVYYLKDVGKWVAKIGLNYKTISLGQFDKYEDAVKARCEAEEKYYREYSYDNSIKSVGDIKNEKN